MRRFFVFVSAFVLLMAFSFSAVAFDFESAEWLEDLNCYYWQGGYYDADGIFISGTLPVDAGETSETAIPVPEIPSEIDSSSELVPAVPADSEHFDSVTSDALLAGSGVSLMNIPSSGTAYSDPIITSVDYAPDAPDGSLLAVLYGLLGKPVTGIHYRYQTGSSSGYTGYSVQQIDYDTAWLGSLLLLIVVIYCLFRLGGAVLCRK